MGPAKLIKWDKKVKKESFVRNDRIVALRELVCPDHKEVCIERARIITQSYMETEGQPIEIRRAKALEKLLADMTIYILDGSLIVGNTASTPVGGKIFPEYGVDWLDKELDTLATRPQDPYFISDDDKKELREEIFPYWRGKTLSDWVQAAMPEEAKRLEMKLFAFGLMKNACGTGHIAIDNEKLIKLGWGGLKRIAQEKLDTLLYEDPGDVDKSIFYRSVIIALDAVCAFSRRYTALARELAKEEKNSYRRQELEAIAGNCDFIAENPPKNYWQGLQMIYFNIIIPIISTNQLGTQAGRIDQNLYPLFKKDLEEGNITKTFAQDILESWFCLFNADAYLLLDADVASRYANYPMGGLPTSGGQTREGLDATNELSHMLLDAEMNIRLAGPEFAVRIHKDTPPDFLRHVCEAIRIGTGKPKLFMDETWYSRGTEMGFPIEDVRDYQGAFCAENSLAGKVYWVPETVGVLGGFGMWVELALNNGIPRLFGEQLGAETGDARNFNTFDEVMEAYKKQVAHVVKAFMPAKQTIAKAHGELVPDPFISAIMDDCLEKGLGWEKGGARYNLFGFGNVGCAVAGNSLAAIKKLVFEDKKITMSELIDTLETNYEGARGEEIRQMLLRAPKFGNDDDYVDSLTREVIQIDINEHKKYRGPQGGYGTGTFDAITAHIPAGWVVGATPDGRRAGEPLNEGGVSPYQGTDMMGPTAVLKSISKLPWSDPNMYGGVLNLRINPTTLEGEEGLEKFAALIRTYNRIGGHHVQFNCVNREILEDAQIHPDNYENLVIRVAGYSSYFTGLARDIQDDIIARTEHSF